MRKNYHWLAKLYFQYTRTVRLITCYLVFSTVYHTVQIDGNFSNPESTFLISKKLAPPTRQIRGERNSSRIRTLDRWIMYCDVDRTNSAAVN